MTAGKASIVILHPEGNYNTNPHLEAFIEVLCEKGLQIDLCVARLPIEQTSLHANLRLRRQSAGMTRALRLLARHRLGGLPISLICFFQHLFRRPSLVLGIDALGLVMAARVARMHRCAYALISYELLFDDEAGRASRVLERRACAGLEFAIVQDELRGRQLSRETGIDLRKFFYMPVAASGEVRLEPGWLRASLGIPPGKKIAIVIGSTDAWTGVPELVRTVPQWPGDWCLVIHHRYGLDAELTQWMDREDLEPVYISTGAVRSNSEMGRILADADVGIAMYFPDHASTVSGQNLEHIGMASGKISTLLQCGIPVLTNQIGEMADHVQRLELGGVVEDVADVPVWLASFAVGDESRAQRCRDFFARRLDVRATGAGAFAAIEDIIQGQLSTEAANR